MALGKLRPRTFETRLRATPSDAHAMLRTRDRVADRFTGREHEAWNFDPCAARVHIDFKGDGMEHRRMLIRAHGTEYPPHCGHVLSFLARQYFYQCLSLAYVSTLIDNELHAAVALVHCTRPTIAGGGAQTIQPDIAEMSLINLLSRERFAEPLVR
jgi:hypothetical protein